jgi:hypothetical protein
VNQHPHLPQGERPTERFSDRAGDYAKHRPTYPNEAIDAAVGGLKQGDWAADIGAGTGISTCLLLGRNINVHAIEPNGPMREHGEAETAAHLRTAPPPTPQAHWHATTGESTGLPKASVVLVFCAQSLHWLNAREALQEFARIRIPSPHSRVAALWNVHDVRDPMMAAYRELVMRHAKDVPRSPWFRNDQCPLASPDAAAAGFTGYRLQEFPTHQTLTLEGLLGRAVSSSYMPKDGPARKAADADLTDFFHRFAPKGDAGGTINFRYICEVHTAHLK